MRNYSKKILVPPENSDYSIKNNITNEEIPIALGSKIIQPKKQYVNEDGELLCKPINGKERFVKMYYETTRRLKYALTPKEGFLFLELTTYINMHTGIIVINKKCANLKDITTALEVDYDNFRKIMKKYIKLDLIHIMRYDRRNVYVVNPFLSMNGEYITECLRDEFINTIWATGAFKNMKKEQFEEMLNSSQPSKLSTE